MTMPTRSSTTVVPIAAVDRQTALRFAQQQPTREKATQVYRNTLAVLAARHCLDLLKIPTNLEASDCWNPFSRLVADVADLPVIGSGSLECRPVSPEAQHCDVPPEALENRIGYLVVQLDPSCQEATMLGFASSAIGESLALKQLHPLEALLIHLEALSTPQTVTPFVQLSQWLHKVVESGKEAHHSHSGLVWQTVDTWLGRLPEPAFAFRSFQDIALAKPERMQQIIEQLYASQRLGHPQADIVPLPSDADFKAALVQLIRTTADEEVRWKAAEILWTIDPGNPASGMRRVLDLGLLLARQPIVLMVAILQPDVDTTSALESRFSILARVYPLAAEGYLPPALQLAVLGQDGSLGLETQSRERDNYIQLKLRGTLGEQFSLRLCLANEVITESFAI